jgi:Tfp pilus assembly protein PilO
MNTKQIDISAIAILVLLLTLSYFTLFRTERARVTDLKEKEKVLSETLAKAGDMHVELNRMQEEINTIQMRLEEFDRRLPEDKRIYDFLRTIDRLAENHGIRMDSIEPGAIERESLYIRIPIKITASARFPDFYRFLYQLEQIPRITRTDGLRISRSPERGPEASGENLCKIEIELAVFVGGG